MIGMTFTSFIVLLIISVIVSLILHYGLRMLIVPGTTSLISKIILGWIGAWLGSPVFGHWFEGLTFGQVYIIPAILGALAIQILAVDIVKTISAGSSQSTQ